jgi:serine protease Do
MKTIPHPLFRSALCGFLVAPVLALEPPADNAPPPPAPVDEAPAPPEEAPAAADEAPPPPLAMPQAAAPAAAYLGIGTSQVPDVLATHLGIQPGEGVVVRSLDPDGPAAKAGLAEHDVVTRIGGKAVGSHAELSAIILEQKPNDELVLDVIQQGKVLEKKVTLGERPDLQAAAPMPGDPLMFEGLPEDQAKRLREAIERNLRAMDGLGGGVNPRDARPPEFEQLDGAMKEMRERIAEMLKDAQGGVPRNGGGMQQFQLQIPGIQGGGNGGFGRIEIQRNARVRMMDENGSIEMKPTEDGKEVTVRDRQDNITWSGPWDTEQDKAAAPDNIRERVEQLNLQNNAGNGLRLQLDMVDPFEEPELPELPELPEEVPAEEE